MIDDLKKDSGAWEREQRERRQPRQHRTNGPGINQSRGPPPSAISDEAALANYVDSRTHQRRQMTGPSVPETPSPGIPDYPTGRGPPQQVIDYKGQPSPRGDSQYSVPPSNPGYPPANTGQGHPGYIPISEAVPGRPAPAFEYPGYPPDPAYGGHPVQTQSAVPAARNYPQPPQTAPPQR